MEAIRQFAVQHGRRNCLFLHVTLVPYIAASQEMKTKPTQHSVKELLSLGIQPDIIVCRSDRHLSAELKDKIALFCNVKRDCVIENCDVPLLYEAPLVLEEEGLASIVCREFGLENLSQMCIRDRYSILKLGGCIMNWAGAKERKKGSPVYYTPSTS